MQWNDTKTITMKIIDTNNATEFYIVCFEVSKPILLRWCVCVFLTVFAHANLLHVPSSGKSITCSILRKESPQHTQAESISVPTTKRRN